MSVGLSYIIRVDSTITITIYIIIIFKLVYILVKLLLQVVLNFILLLVIILGISGGHVCINLMSLTLLHLNSLLYGFTRRIIIFYIVILRLSTEMVMTIG
mmetsp:Transcript_14507/g.2105  ORF Transcript_14507/g.2105 Transcript_14507/m.2105 type:complete len:100 (+) Transcript_14507:170-469(+)